MDAQGKTGFSSPPETPPPMGGGAEEFVAEKTTTGSSRSGKSAAGNGHHRTRIPPESPATGAAKTIPAYFAEFKAYATYFLSAKVDGVKSSIKNAIIYAALGVVGLLAAAGIIFTAVFLLLAGIAIGLGHLFGGRIWLGDIVVGILVLGGIGVGAYIAMGKFTKASRLKTEQKYEDKRNQQRLEFGRDVHERAGRS